jgi:hypothetical protein
MRVGICRAFAILLVLDAARRHDVMRLACVSVKDSVMLDLGGLR